MVDLELMNGLLDREKSSEQLSVYTPSELWKQHIYTLTVYQLMHY